MDTDELKPWYGLVGKSEPMMKLYEEIKSVADSDATVLLIGETGTGKELVARAIHHLSPRKDRPYEPFDCTAVPIELFESELFGYKKGAFTGATGDKAGLIAEAECGTIFLDEIGEMHPYLQGKLLRTIQQRSYRRVGDTKNTDFDVRLIVATSKAHKLLADSNQFNKGLYYRINQLGIDVPPLRERGDDLIHLTWYYLNMFNNKYRKDIKMETGALEEIRGYHWPGNVRQLMALVEKYVVKSKPGGVITKDDVARDLAQTKRELTLDDLHKELKDLRDLTEKSAKEGTGKGIESFAEALERFTEGLKESVGRDREQYKVQNDQMLDIVKEAVKARQQPQSSGGIDQMLDDLKPKIYECIRQEFGDAVSSISGKLTESFRGEMHELIREGIKPQKAQKPKHLKKARDPEREIRLSQGELAEAAGVPKYTIANAIRLGSLASEGNGKERTVSVTDALELFRKRKKQKEVSNLKKYIKESD